MENDAQVSIIKDLMHQCTLKGVSTNDDCAE